MAEVTAPQVIGRYAIYGKMASGGMASVHFGRLLGGAGFSRTVAIKRLHPHLAEDPEFLAAMIDEARLAARIHHPNVVPTLDVVATDGELLLVMEYVRGESLARLLKAEAAAGRRAPLPITGAILVGTLHGLHAAHEATSDRGEALDIVHRDVSPQNILVGADGVARVIDFGVAKAAGRLQTTRDGVIKGKLAYMAPEQLRAGEVTRAADVYAVGVVLWETLTGKRAFDAPNDAALVGQVLAGAKEPPSAHAEGLPPELDALVMRALAPRPADRFSTALDMAEALMRILPPAFSTDVGKWCREVAHESLAKRGAQLADIESSSGAAAAVPSSNPAMLESPAAPQDAPVAAREGTTVDDAPTVTSQPSSVTLETPKPAPRPPLRARRAVALGALVLAATTAAWLFGAPRTKAAGGAPDVTLVVPTSIPPEPAAPSGAEESLPSSSTALPLASAEAPPPAPSVAAPATRARQPSKTTGAAAVHASTVRAAPSSPPATSATLPAAPKPSDDCTPEFYYDEEGHKHFKPECFRR